MREANCKFRRALGKLVARGITLGILGCLAMSASGMAAQAAPGSVTASGQIWHAEQQLSAPPGSNPYNFADSPVYRFSLATNLAKDIVGEFRMTQGSDYTYYREDGTNVPGKSGNYKDWAVSVTKYLVSSGGRQIGLIGGLENRNMRVTIIGAESNFKYENVFVGGEMSVPLDGPLSLMGRVTTTVSGSVLRTDDDGYRARTEATVLAVKVGGVYDLGGMMLEGGWQSETVKELRSAQWPTPIQTQIGGPYLGLSFVF